MFVPTSPTVASTEHQFLESNKPTNPANPTHPSNPGTTRAWNRTHSSGPPLEPSSGYMGHSSMMGFVEKGFFKGLRTQRQQQQRRSPHCSSPLALSSPAKPEAFDLVLRHGRNSSLVMLRSDFPGLVPGAQGSVAHLFLDVSLYILGSDSTVDHMVSSFFGRLFPLTYRRLLGGGASAGSEECLRGAWKDSAAFGPYPKLMMTRLSRSLLATRVFLQALNLGIEVVNTTNHLRPGRDCGRSLLRLWYCPQCQALLGVPVCQGFCQAVMQGCLGGAAEVQPHWRTYVDGLGKLAGGMRGEQDIEAVVMRLPSMIRTALKHAVNARSRLLSTFISSLRGFGFFYSGLGEALCSREPAPGNHSLCWNGQEMTDRFAGPGLKRTHPHGSESKNNKVPEPVISQIIDKLKHINQ
ncbi:hypothetical protein NHX12_012090, partial [Muraenolepis orangiensis]